VKTVLKEFQRYSLAHNVTFVSYIMPGSKVPNTLYLPDSDAQTFQEISDITNESGFILAPFQSENFPIVVIPDKEKLTGWEFELAEFPKPLNATSHVYKNTNLNNYEVSFEEYASQIDTIKENFRLGNGTKVVLSRIKVLCDINYKELPEMFEALVELYPHAFVYLLYTPQSGVWIGATPETLLQIDNSSFSTMALAGTKAYLSQSVETKWAEKEIKEQEHVVSHVRQKLTEGGYKYDESLRETSRAGNVVHLKTLFTGKLNSYNSEWKKLVNLLYPTPAICGNDDENTLQIIRNVEKHNREYYAGIIGPFGKNGNTDLFINLRCMKIANNLAILFAGGGILNESVAEKEWEETELKFNTLIQVIQKVLGAKE